MKFPPKINSLKQNLNSLGLDEEVGGEASALSRRLRQKQTFPGSNFNTNAKRAQSVETLLDRIPSVVGANPNDHIGMYYYLFWLTNPTI